MSGNSGYPWMTVSARKLVTDQLMVHSVEPPAVAYAGFTKGNRGDADGDRI